MTGYQPPLNIQLPTTISNLKRRLTIAEHKIEASTSAIGTPGASITFAPTPPGSPRVGDLWYNTGNGNQVSQWNGTSWGAYLISTGAIGNNAVTNALLANNSVAEANVQSDAISTDAIQTSAVSAVQASAAFHGLNMVPDSQFAISSITTVRLTDPATTPSVWTVTSPNAACTIATGTAAYFSLMPSDTSNPSMFVNPGEQYYLSVVVTVTGAMTVGLQLRYTDGTTTALTHSYSTSASGQVLSAVITIPSSEHGAYAQFFATNSSGSTQTATFSAPICQLAQLNGGNWTAGGGGFFLYNGTPRNGDMVASIAEPAGTDPYGFAYTDGFASYGPNNGQAQLACNQTSGVPYLIMKPASVTHMNTAPQAFGASAHPGTATEQEQFEVFSGNPVSADSAALLLSSESFDKTIPSNAQITVTGQTYNAGLVQSDNTVYTLTANNSDTQACLLYAVTSGYDGAMYRLTSWGNGTGPSGGTTLYWMINSITGSGGTILAQTPGYGISSGQVYCYRSVAEVMLVSTNKVYVFLTVTIGCPTNSALSEVVSAYAANTTIGTFSPGSVQFELLMAAGTTGGATVGHSYGSTFEKVG